jgi:hypothetical protein
MTNIEIGKPRQKWAIIESLCWDPNHHLPGATPKLEARITEMLPHQDDVTFPKLQRTSKLFTFDWHGYVLKS